MTTVLFSTVFPDGAPRRSREVLVVLVAGSAGGSDGAKVIGDTVKVRLDATGAGTADLTPNDTLTPAGTFYRCTVQGAQPSVVRTIRITSTTPDPVSWADPTIQVLAPAPPEFTPIVGPQGPAGDLILIDGGNASSVFTPPASLDGGSA